MNSACACMGPRPGDEYCPCRMRDLGIPLADPWTPEKQAEAELKIRKAFAKYQPTQKEVRHES